MIKNGSILFVALFTALYLVQSFVALSFDPSDWTSGARGFTAFMPFLIVMITGLAWFFDEEMEHKKGFGE